ncbi:MAG: trigger factor [Spirochaetaceae bacterium]|nr:trigger factor [Spirochaetaceae bacterium]
MAVTQEITHLENSAVRLTFTYNNEDLRAKYSGVVNGIAKDLRINGFRKGKAPVSVLERKLGKALQEDVLNTIIANTVNDAIKDEGFPKEAVPLPYSEPQVEGEPKLDLSGDFVFSVKYDAAPRFTVDRWEGFEVEVETAEVTDADVESELDIIRERNAIVMDKEDGAAAEKGDVVTVAYSELYEDGGEITSSKRESFTFTLGSARNFFRFDDEITGMKSGETRDFQKSYPADFDEPELAGKTKRLRVKLTAVKRRELPDDDELAQDVDEKFNTIADLRQNIRKSLEEALETSLHKTKIDRIIEKIVEQDPPPVPESMLSMEMFASVDQGAAILNMRDEEKRLFVRNVMENEELKLKTRKKIQAALVREKLINQLNIEVSDDELDKKYQDIAEKSGRTLEAVKEAYRTDGKINEYLTDGIKQERLNELLLEKNTIKAGKKVSFVDIFPKNT